VLDEILEDFTGDEDEGEVGHEVTLDGMRVRQCIIAYCGEDGMREIDFNRCQKTIDMYVKCAYNWIVNYQWDPNKAALNSRKHGVDFADAVGVFEDENALWQEDPKENREERFISLGVDFLGRVLVVVFTFRGEEIRIISARKATENEKNTYERRRE
jgi:uncharacterized DUF497 family protein